MSETATYGPALLLMACSWRKKAGLARGRAWDIYDGQLFRILKKLFRTHLNWRQHLHILIVSARYGILEPEQAIVTYEERLTRRAAQERGSLWADALRRAVDGRRFRAVHVNLGKDYLRVLPELGELFAGAPLDWAGGGIGTRNGQTRRWVMTQLTRRGG
jgi:hypothetical protein